MAITYGFYNSLNGDRKYDAFQMSSIFDGVIRDGVFQSIGGYLATKPGEGMQVLVAPGKAWFDHTWTVNDALYPLDIREPDLTLKRYDAVVLETDGSKPIRKNSIKIIEGISATNPQKPTMVRGESLNQHPLAYVLVKPGATSINAEDIEVVVGKDECPFVTSILESVSIESLLAKWEGEFQTWFDKLQSQMEGDVATNLQNQINALDKRIVPLESLGDRVETNAYNIAMLALLHAKAGEFPPNTRKMIINVPSVSPNVLDYSGLDMDMSALRAIVLTKAAKIRSGSASGITSLNSARENIVSSLVYFKKKQLYWVFDKNSSAYTYRLIAEDKYNRDPSKRQILHSCSMRYVYEKPFDFFKVNENTLYITAYENDVPTASTQKALILSFDGTNITKVADSGSITVNNSDGKITSMLTGDGALFMYGTYGSTGGYAYLLKTTGDMTLLGYDKGYKINSYARSTHGIYFHAGEKGIKLFEADQIISTDNVSSYSADISKVYGNDVFFGTGGSAFNYVTKRTGRLTFKNLNNGSLQGSCFFVIGGELYLYGYTGSVGGVYKFNGETFDNVAENANLFLRTLYSQPVTKSLPSRQNMFSDGLNRTGAGDNIYGYDNTSSFLYIKDTYETSGKLTLSFEDLPSFSTVDLYVGGALTNARLRVSMDGKTWSPVSPNGSTFSGEMHQVMNVSGSGTLYVKIEFDLGSGYIDYIVGGVY